VLMRIIFTGSGGMYRHINSQLTGGGHIMCAGWKHLQYCIVVQMNKIFLYLLRGMGLPPYFFDSPPMHLQTKLSCLSPNQISFPRHSGRLTFLGLPVSTPSLSKTITDPAKVKKNFGSFPSSTWHSLVAGCRVERIVIIQYCDLKVPSH
jgi:hypothetical protein